jgi:hypothetical protein
MILKGLKLNVKYEEKEDAKTAGAKWDYYNRTWYLPITKELEPVLKWISKDLLVYNMENTDNTKQKKKNIH